MTEENKPDESKGRVYDDWIDAYMEQTKRSEPGELYRKWVAISTMAATLQRRVYLKWVGSSHYYPNMYIVLVGPPAARKSTALWQGKSLIEACGIPQVVDTTTRQSLIRSVAEMNSTAQDTSGKSTQHSSATLCSPELTVFLGTANAEMLSLLTDWFDCPDKWEYKTKGSGHDVIVNLFFNMIGAITPALLRSALPQDTIGSGLASRICFIYQSDVAQRIASPTLTAAEEEARGTLIADLQHIKLLKGQFKPTTEFLSLYEKWYIHDYKDDPINAHPKFQTYASRRQVHLLKLSLIFAASRKDTTNDNLTIEARDFRRAMETLLEAEELMPTVLKGYGNAADIEIKALILEALGNALAGKDWTPKSDISEMCIDCGTIDQVNTAFDHLISARVVEVSADGQYVRLRAGVMEQCQTKQQQNNSPDSST